jgi:hypothetical protein
MRAAVAVAIVHGVWAAATGHAHAARLDALSALLFALAGAIDSCVPPHGYEVVSA